MQLSTQATPDGPTLLAVSGEVDLAVADQLRRAAETAAWSSAGRGLILDLSAVTFLDSTGLGALVGIRNSVLGDGGAVVLRNPSAAVFKVLKITGLVDVFDIDDDAAPSRSGIREEQPVRDEGG